MIDAIKAKVELGETLTEEETNEFFADLGKTLEHMKIESPLEYLAMLKKLNESTANLSASLKSVLNK